MAGGAPLDVAAVDAALKRQGQPVRTSPAASGGALTPREREVLALLVRGWSNRAIADELFISRKTTEIHVSNILGKLRCSTRTEAAVLAVAQGWPPWTPDPSPPYGSLKGCPGTK